jgi:hypothetical protein
MFGDVTMMLNGNMLCCVAKQGLMVRVGAQGEAALSHPSVLPCMGTGRRMAGFVMVDHDGLATPQDVASWLRLARAYVMTLPPKAPGKSTLSKEPNHEETIRACRPRLSRTDLHHRLCLASCGFP